MFITSHSVSASRRADSLGPIDSVDIVLISFSCLAPAANHRALSLCLGFVHRPAYPQRPINGRLEHSGPREARDEAAAALTTEVVGIRSTVESAFGAAMLTSLGIDGKTEVEPKAILAKAKRLVSELKDPGRKWPKPARKGVKVNPGEWVSDLETWISALEKALKDVARETREAQAASDAKERSMGANDDSFIRIARFVSGLFFLVGDDKLAKKVRPSARRPGMVLEGPEAGGEGGSDEEAQPTGGDSEKSGG